MIEIFDSLKKSLFMLGISHRNESNRVLLLARIAVVWLVLGSGGICMAVGIFVSDDIAVIVECIIFSTFCFAPLVMYAYMMHFKSKLFNIIEALESTMNESNQLKFLRNNMKELKRYWNFLIFYRTHSSSNVGKFRKYQQSDQ